MSNRKGTRADFDELLDVAWKRQKWALAHGGTITIPTPKSPAWKKYMRWGAFSLGTLLWASGIAAMYGDDYKLAVCLYFFGIAIVAADFITLEGHAEYRGLKKAILVVSV